MQECNELAEQGKNKDCFGCSCSICLADYKPLNNELGELKAKIKEAEERINTMEDALRWIIDNSDTGMLYMGERVGAGTGEQIRRRALAALDGMGIPIPSEGADRRPK